MRPKNPPISESLADLPRMDRNALLVLWERIFGKPANPALRREMLVPVLAYRLQEVEFGGLRSSIENQLQAIAQAGRNWQDEPRLFRPKPGTRFVREWRGKLHEVSVVPDGYEYNDHTYSSLSEIARLITGTRWSGPAFFGLRRRREVEAD